MSEFKFDAYVCEGDTSTVEHDGYIITARIEFDQFTTPDDDEFMSEEATAAWRNNEWFYCGVVLSVSYNEVLLINHAASLWGVDANFPGSDNSYLAEVAEELLPEAIEIAKEARQAMLINLSY